MHRPFYSYDISITLERISSQVHTILMGMLMGKSYAGASQLEPHVSAFGSSIVETCVVLTFLVDPPGNWKLCGKVWKMARVDSVLGLDSTVLCVFLPGNEGKVGIYPIHPLGQNPNWLKLQISHEGRDTSTAKLLLRFQKSLTSALESSALRD